MDSAKLIARWQEKLRENIRQSEYQSQFAGERLGVFAELRRLTRERRQIARRLIELDPENKITYIMHTVF